MAISGVDTGLVVGQFILGLVDGVDVDDEPDMVGARGIFEFAPALNYVPVPLGDPNPFTLIKDTFLAVLDDEGYICTPDPDFPYKPGKRGLRLFATDSVGSSVTGWTWKVTPKFINQMGMPIASYIPPFNISVPTNGTVDLATAIKVPSSTGLGTEQIVVLAAKAQESATYSAQQAEYAAEEASSAGISAWEATEVSQQAMAVSALAERVATGVQKQAEDGEFVPNITVKVNTVANPADDVWMSDIIRESPLVSATLREVFPASMQGAKGDAGGLVASSKVYSTQQANNLTTPGYYYQMSGVTDTTLNWPASFRGIMVVYGDPADVVTQEFNPQRVTDAQDRFFYRRTRVGGTWSGWRMYTSQRVDNTAGRAIYTWDNIQNREQLVYGDTGWRDVSGDSDFGLQNGWKAQSVHVRRTGSSVHYLFRVLDGTAATGVVIMTPPNGFRITSAIPAYLSHPVIITDTTIRNIAIQGLSGTMQSLTGWTTGDRIVPILSTTMDAWPTTLPGTAVDTIPNL